MFHYVLDCTFTYVILNFTFSLLSIVITNREQYITNLNNHGRNTRQGSDIHHTISNLSLCHRGSYNMGLKGF